MQRLAPIYETVRKVKAALSPETTFLGFAGSPWTVATYMIAGQGSREQAEARRLAYADPGKLRFDPRSDRHRDGRLSVRPDRGRGRCRAIVRQLVGQPGAGPVRALRYRAARRGSSTSCASATRGAGHRLPASGAGGKLGAYARETGVDAIGLDETVDPGLGAQRELPDGMPVQGNLDPLALIAGGAAAEGRGRANP